MKKIILAALAVALLLSSCEAERETEDMDLLRYKKTVLSQQESGREEGFDSIAAELLDNDLLISGIYFNGALSGFIADKNYDPFAYNGINGSEFDDYAAITELVERTYAPESGVAEFLYSFPEFGNKAVAGIGGKTYISTHFAVKPEKEPPEVAFTVYETENEGKKLIKINDKLMFLVLSDGVWKLSGSFFREYLQYVGNNEDIVLPGMNDGSAQKLDGRILCAVIFISDKNFTFNNENKKPYMDMISSGAAFIEGSNDNLSIDIKELNYVHGSELVLDEENIYAFDSVLVNTSYRSLDNYINENFDTDGYDGYFTVLCVGGGGNIFYLPYDKEESEIFYIERVVMPGNFDAGALVKNILYIFGADYTDGAVEAVYKYFPDDVLLTGTLENSEISVFTAFRTGLAPSIDAQLKYILNGK